MKERNEKPTKSATVTSASMMEIMSMDANKLVD